MSGKSPNTDLKKVKSKTDVSFQFLFMTGLMFGSYINDNFCFRFLQLNYIFIKLFMDNKAKISIQDLYHCLY